MCTILAESAAVFGACVGLHVLVWRIRLPTGYRTWLPSLIAIFVGVGATAAWWLVQARVLPAPQPRADVVTEWMAVMLLHGSASAVYIIGYTLLSAFSPSIEILKRLEHAPRGLCQDEIDVPILRTAVGGERVSNLMTDGLLMVDGGVVALAPRAQMLVRVALWYRHAVGLPDGTGG